MWLVFYCISNKGGGLIALALLDTVQHRVIDVVNANPGVWSASVSGQVGAFKFQQLIDEAIFEADANIVVNGYFQSINSELVTPFGKVSDPLTHGSDVPFHHGEVSLVELTNDTSVTDDTVWIIGIEAKSQDDVIEGKAIEAYIQENAYSALYKIFGGQFYTGAAFGRVTYPEYIRTSALQCNQNETTLLVAEAVKILARNGSPALFEYYGNLSAQMMAGLVQDGRSTELDLTKPPAG